MSFLQQAEYELFKSVNKEKKVTKQEVMDVIPGENAYINAVLDYKHD